MEGLFPNRREAGKFLAQKLQRFAGRTKVMVLAIPRGGVPVALEIAKEIGAPLDVFIVRKLGVPGHEELAMGAIASGGARVLNEEIVMNLGITSHMVDAVAAAEERELMRQEQEYRACLPALDFRGSTAILVDDGLATGASMRVAVRALKKKGPAHIVVAVPVGALETCREMRKEADEVICGMSPIQFTSVGACYEHFAQVTDDEVRDVLMRFSFCSKEDDGEKRNNTHL